MKLPTTHLFVSLLILQFRLAGYAGSSHFQEGNRPNVIFIFSDDLGWGDLGCYGNRDIRTPNLDKLAEQGLLLTDFYVSNPVCSPSRTAIMTGQYPSRHRIHTALGNTFEHNRTNDQADFLDPGNVLLTRLFQDNGYTTGHFGKWHLGATPGAPSPSAYGIDEHMTANSVLNDLKCPRHQSSEKIMDAAIQFVTKNKERPFYLNVWTLVPHALLDPTPDQMATYQDFGPQGEAKRRGFSTPAQIYYASVSDLDKQVGRLFEAIKKLGLAEKTVIIFSSDNGPEDISIPNAAHSGAGSPGPFRGRKRSLYEGGIRVPFIVSWPGHIPEGKVDPESVVGGVDLLPSLCRFAGIDLPAGYLPDGEDMSAVFLGNPKQRTAPLMWDWRFSQAGHTLNKSPQLALRTDRWKFLVNPDGSRPELYDFNADVQNTETDNVADKYPEIAEKFKLDLLKFERSLPQGKRLKSGGKNTYTMPGE
jgi:arylsulfatase A-like enzyme